jgi:hypothetical protein
MAEPLIDFVALGGQTIPTVPDLRCVPLALPNCSDLYYQRCAAVRSSPCEWLCFVDGGDDIIGPDFVPAMVALAGWAAEAGYSIGWAAETAHGGPPNHRQQPHHGVVCNVAALRAIRWPAGCYHWEAIAYGVLKRGGHVFDPVPRYDWRPGPGGARLWPTTRTGIGNSMRWLRENRA